MQALTSATVTRRWKLAGWIAEADAAGVAIFAIGTGVQFHPESTPTLIRDVALAA